MSLTHKQDKIKKNYRTNQWMNWLCKIAVWSLLHSDLWCQSFIIIHVHLQQNCPHEHSFIFGQTNLIKFVLRCQYFTPQLMLFRLHAYQCLHRVNYRLKILFIAIGKYTTFELHCLAIVQVESAFALDFTNQLCAFNVCSQLLLSETILIFHQLLPRLITGDMFSCVVSKYWQQIISTFKGTLCMRVSLF